jgi:hypothetical protein
VDVDFDNLSFALYEPPTIHTTQAVSNILSPLDLLYAVNGVTLGSGRGLDKVVDGSSSKMLMSILPNQVSGFDVTPISSLCTVANGLTIFGADDPKGNDPSEVQVLARNAHDDQWTLLGESLLAMHPDRNLPGKPIKDSLKHKFVALDNMESYTYYRVLFPNTKDPSSASLHVGELQLSGYLCSEDYEAPPPEAGDPTVFPNFHRGSVANVAYNKMTSQTSTTAGASASRAVDGNVNPFASGQSIALTGPGASWTVDLGEEYYIQSVNALKRMDECCLGGLENFAVEFQDSSMNTVYIREHRDAVPGGQAWTTLDLSSDLVGKKAQHVTIHAWGNTPLNLAEVQVMAPIVLLPQANEWPTGNEASDAEPVYVENVLSSADIVTGWGRKSEEGPSMAVDEVGWKYAVNTTLSGESAYLELVPAQSTCTIVKGLRVFTSNLKDEYDPTSYVVEGMNKLTGEWDLIAQGSLDLPLQRNALSAETVMDRDTAFSYEATFSNLERYYQYRVTFPTTKDASSALTEVAEIQMSGLLCHRSTMDVPHPPTSSPTEAPEIDLEEFCKDLVNENGDAELSTVLFDPFEQSYSTAPMPHIEMESDGNHYFSIQERTRWVDGLTLFLQPDCVRNDWPYIVSFDYRLHSPTPLAASVRMDYQDTVSGEWIKGAVEMAVST